jgi:hypothetical protein
MTKTANSFVGRSNAVRAARKAGLDCSKLTFVQDGARWSWTSAEAGGFAQLSSADADFGVVPAEGAEGHAQALANEGGVAITVRDTLTDDVLAAVEPESVVYVSPAAEPGSDGEVFVAARNHKRPDAQSRALSRAH